MTHRKRSGQERKKRPEQKNIQINQLDKTNDR